MTTGSSTGPWPPGSPATCAICSRTTGACCSDRPHTYPWKECGMAAQEIRVPDIGDFSDVPIIEIHVNPGDTVAAEDPLLTLESDKATLDVPSPVAGTIASLTVAVGDTVSQGTVIGTVDVAGAGDGEPAKETVTSQPAATAGGGAAGGGEAGG